MSPNIPLTTPIESSMNVSGFKIDVGIAMAQTSGTWSIPDIYITPEISSKAKTQSRFSYEFILNPGCNPVESQEPLGKHKQPSINIPSGFQVHVGHAKWVDGG
ncbi:hypothetical protein O181_008300 [Austropuccinia psidii MF-1]|uniref:Uncharacterized protein n=1 Tax=Austropuccinia psidii MF-1 TaxID=1389203 RepID=A0A9Q3BPN6_9BASI|nr:hypothetical protein [Austropuccinia psidii MF-1]